MRKSILLLGVVSCMSACGADDKSSVGRADAGHAGDGSGQSGIEAAGASAGTGAGTGHAGEVSGADAGVMLARIEHRRIAMDTTSVCFIDDGSVLHCERNDGSKWKATGKFSDVVPGPAALRDDGTILSFMPDWAKGGFAACVEGNCEHRPTHGKFIDLAIDEPTGCGLIDDGSVECWGSNAPTHLPDSPQVKIAFGNNFMLCSIDDAGKPTCWTGDAVSPIAAWGIHDKPIVQITSNQSDAVALLDSSGRSFVVVDDWQVLHLSALGYVFADSRSGIALDGTYVPGGVSAADRVQPPPGPFIQGATTWSDVCALRRDGTPACWGTTWGKGADTEQCLVLQAKLEGSIAGGKLDYSGYLESRILPSDTKPLIRVSNVYDLIAFGRSDHADLPKDVTSYGTNETVPIEASTLVLSDTGDKPAAYCVGAGSTLRRQGDELVVHLANVTKLEGCEGTAVSGKLSTCRDAGCTVTSNIEGQDVTTTVQTYADSRVGDVSDLLVAYADGTIVRSATDSHAWNYIFTTLDGPHAGAVYCASVIDTTSEGTALFKGLKKLGTCKASKSNDAIDGCIRP